MTDSVPILMYHAVSDDAAPGIRRLSVTPRSLDRQVGFLADHGYTAMTFSGLTTAYETDTPLPAKPVVLTFDDGYADFVHSAWPILRRRDFPATVFVTSGWLADAGVNAAGSPLDRMMTRAQIGELAAAGIEIGAHSHSHPELDQCSDATLRTELRVSREHLEDCIGAPVPTLAYPFGYSTPRVRRAARAVGYRCAAAVRNIRATSSDDSFTFPRLTIRRSTDDDEFAAIMAGGNRQVFLRDRLLTSGWATVRGARRAGKRVLGHV